MEENPFRYKRDGAWSSSHSLYYQRAYEAYADFEKIVQKLTEKERELQKENSEMEPDELWPYIHHTTSELWEEAYKFAAMVQLFSCMAIEAFLNHYGVRCLGEAFYKRNIERTRIAEKLSILMVTCNRKLIDENSSLAQKIRTLFEARNQLVHPKSRQIDFDRIHEFATKNPKDLNIKEIIDNMEQILSQICEMDHDIDFDLEFIKPNPAVARDG